MCQTFVSSSIERSIGWAPDEVIGRSIVEFFHPDDLIDAVSHFQQIQAGRTTETERRLLDATMEIVAARGVRAVTLAAVGTAAGYSRGIVTHQFGSRRGLLDALTLMC